MVGGEFSRKGIAPQPKTTIIQLLLKHPAFFQPHTHCINEGEVLMPLQTWSGGGMLLNSQRLSHMYQETESQHSKKQIPKIWKL